jgi:hypothetical protein
MQETYSSLIQACIDYTLNVETQSQTARTATKTLFGKEINKTIRWIYDFLNLFKTEKTDTSITTLASTQFYNKKNYMGNITAITVAIGGIAYPLTPVDSYDAWNALNATTYSGSLIPKFFFQRQKDFGIYPTPGANGDTITIVYNPLLKDLSLEDVTTGTIAVTNGDATVTLSGSTFLNSYADKWIRIDDDGYWYRISSITDTTHLELEKTFEGTTDTSSTYIIADCPELPPEIQALIPHHSIAAYFAGPRSDPEKAQAHLNFFFTGDYTNLDRTGRNIKGGIIYYKLFHDARGRGNDPLVRRDFTTQSRFDDSLTTIT